MDTIKVKFIEALSRDLTLFDFYDENCSEGVWVYDLDKKKYWVNKRLIRNLNNRNIDVAFLDSFLSDNNISSFETSCLKTESSTCKTVENFEYQDTSLSIELNLTINGSLLIGGQRFIENNGLEQKHESYLNDIDRIFNLSVDLLCIAGYDGYFKTLNPAWEKLLGWSKEELTSLPWIDFVHPDDIDATKKSLSKVINGSTIYQFVNRYKCKDGTYKWLSWNSHPYPKENKIFAVACDVTKQKEESSRLELSKLRYKGLLDTLEAGVVVHRADSSIIEINQKALELLNLKHNEALGKGISDASWSFVNLESEKIEPEDYPVSKVLSTLKPINNCVYGIKHVDNVETTWVLVSGFPVIDSNSSIKEVVISFIDISEQIRSQKILKENENQLKDLFDYAGDAMVIASIKDEAVLATNKAAESLFKRTQDELIGLNITKLHPSSITEKSNNIFKKTIEELSYRKKTTPLEHEIVTRWNEIIPVEIIATKVIYNEQESLLGIFRDISDRIERDREIKSSEERFKQIAETNQSVIWEVDVNGDFIYVSPIAEKIWGYKPEELIGKINYFDLHPKDSREEFKRTTYKLAEKGEVFRGFVNQIKRKDDTIIWVSTGASPVYNEKKEIIGYRGSDQDITYKLRLEEELKNTSEMMHKLVDQVPGVVYQFKLTPDGKTSFPFSSIGMKEIYEYLPHEVQTDAQPVFERLHPDDIERVTQDIYDSAASLNIFNCEFRVVLPNKGVQWRISNARPERLEDGSTLWYGIITDITKQKEYELALKTSEEKFRVVLNNFADIVVLLDEESKQVYVSPVCETITGYKPEELIGKGMEDIVHPDNIPETARIWAEMLENPDRAYRAKYRHIHKAKGWVWLEGSAQNLWDNPAINAVLLTVRDISEQVKFETELLKLSKAVEQSPVSIVITDTDGRIEYVNPQFESLTGYTFEEVVGENPNILKSGHQQPSFYEQLWKTISNGDTWTGELRNKKKDGSFYWEAVNISPIINDKGEITHYLAVKENITHRKAVEKKLIENEERYRSIISVSNTGAWEYDLETRTLWCSPEYFEMLGYKEEDFANLGHRGHKIWEELLHPDDFEKAREVFINYYTGDMNEAYENYFRLVHKKGHSVWIWSRAKNLRNTDGSPSSKILGTHIDITETKLAEIELRKKADELKLAESVAIHKSELLGAVAESIVHITQNEDWSSTIDHCLALLGKAMNVDRTYLFKNSIDAQFTSHIAEWAAHEELAEINNEDLQDLPMENFPFFKETLYKRKVFEGTISSFEDEGSKNFLDAQSIKTILLIPVFVLNRFWGFIGFDDCQNERVITPDERNIMTSFADSLGRTILLSEKKRELEESETKLRSILDSTLDHNILLGKDYSILNLNKTAENGILWAFGEKPKLNESFKKYIMPGFEATFELHFNDALKGNFIEQEYMVPVDNDNFWYNYHFYPVFSKNNTIRAVSINITDITEQKRAAIKLTEAYERTKILQVALDNVPVAVYMKDTKSRYTYANKTALKIFKCDLDELKGKSDYDFFDEETSNNLVEIDREVLNGKVSKREVSTKVKDNSQKHFLEFKSPIYGEEKSKLVGLLGLSTDVTPLKRAEKQIRESEEYQRKLLQTIPDIIFVFDKNGVYLDVNANSENLLFDASEIIGKNVTDTMPKDLAVLQINAIEKALKEKELIEFNYELFVNKQNRYFKARFIALGDERVLSLVTDITAATENLNRITNLLRVEEEQNKRLRNFTHIVSHNLRSHTSNMQGLISLLELEEPLIFENMYVQMLKESSDNLNETIGHLNEVLDINLSDQKPKSDINISKILTRAIANVSLIAQNSGVKVINEIPEDVYVKGIPAYVESIIFNLVTNALKFKSPDRESYVKISCEKSNSFLHLKFKDNGLGIDLDRYKDKIFGMYKTFHGFKDSKGLGLFISKNQAIAMGGNIEVQSRPDEGTTFTVYLPCE